MKNHAPPIRYTIDTSPRRNVMAARALSLCLLGLLAAGAAHAQSGDTGDEINPDTMKQTFSDEFDTLDVSSWGPGTRWIAHTPWSGDFGSARFANPGQRTPFSTKDGILQIEAKRDPEGDWQSGLLASVDPKGNGFSQQYGYFEMRASLPDGPGVWPAFWLIGKDRSKSTAEIDVIEYYGDKPGAYSSAVHVWYKDDRHYTKGERIPAFETAKPTEFHTYGVKVDPAFIRMYFDRKLVWKTPTQEEHKQPLYILIDLALVDGDTKNDAPDPSRMHVDYVRSFSLD